MEGESLGTASRFKVKIAERVGRVGGSAAQVAKRLAAAILGKDGDEPGFVEIEKQAFPVDASNFDTTLAVLGLIWASVADAAGIAHLDPSSPTFLMDWRAVLAEAFSRLRRAADARGHGAVDKEFDSRESCERFLTLLGVRLQEHEPATEERPSKRARTAPAVPKSEDDAVRLLTWNIAGRDVAHACPKSRNVRDKLLAMKREILRLKPDVLALQECPGGGRCEAVPEDMDLVGVVEAHPEDCYVQLYVRSPLAMQRVALHRDVPAVAGICKVKDTPVCFVSAHLHPHAEHAAKRAEQLQDILSACGSGKSIVLMGDMNVQRAEVPDLCDAHALTAMRYANCSWDPRRNKFYANLKNYRGEGKVYDQIWSLGPVWVEGHMVGMCKEYRAGERFFLSDHFALLGLLDVHDSYGAAGGGESSLADKRRECLASLRTSSAAQERLYYQTREADGERSLALEADRELQKERGKQMRAEAKARREKEAARRRLLEEVFGDGSLLQAQIEGSMPAEACSFDLEAFDGLPAGKAAALWSQHVQGGHHCVCPCCLVTHLLWFSCCCGCLWYPCGSHAMQSNATLKETKSGALRNVRLVHYGCRDVTSRRDLDRAPERALSPCLCIDFWRAGVLRVVASMILAFLLRGC